MAIDCIAAIFCGGASTRFGVLGRARAKTLLPVHDRPLLWRTIDQLRTANFTRIVAVTTPPLAAEIQAAADRYDEVSSFEVGVSVCEEQSRGMLFGLGALTRDACCDRLLVCLGDIFFLENPFPAFRDALARGDDCLGVTRLALAAEWRAGGLVFTQDNRVERICERPIEAPRGATQRWSGNALIHRARCAEDLGSFLAIAPDDTPPGDFFEFQRQSGLPFSIINGPDFVNINTPDHLVLASLYALLNSHPSPSGLSESIQKSAELLRHHLAETVKPSDR